MKIIMINREFGSGGRKLGKHLSDVLNFDYYDNEIVTALAANQKMDEGYIAMTLEWNIKELTSAVAEFVNCWFERSKR